MGGRSVKTNLTVIAAAAMSAVLAACAIIGSSSTFEFASDDTAKSDTAKFLGCRSTLGSYSLPKHVLHFTITKTEGQNFHVLNPIGIEPVPDNRHVFCLDHLSSGFSDDEVRVFKNKIVQKVDPDDKTHPKEEKEDTPYLQLIASKAVDHTAGIVRRFIRAAFILLTNRADFATARSSVNFEQDKVKAITVADFKVDPFDYQEMARVNFSVREFGFCFVMENYTFDRSRGTGISPDQYCSAPYQMAVQKPPRTAEAIQKMRYLVEKPVSGIFFRPRASYRLSVYVKANPRGRDAWRPGLIKNFEFENIMPIVSVGVSRAMFAIRRTGLVFEDGMLKNVCISKGSEVEGAIQIPLDVVYGLIALPSQVTIGAIEGTETAKKLIDARQQLIAAQNNYIKFLNGGTYDEALLKQGGTKKKENLKLGNSLPNQVFDNDDSSDAGAISVSGAESTVLNDICKELTADNLTKLGGRSPDGGF